MPAMFLLILFIGVPILELAVILRVGGAIGGWNTVAVLVLDSIIGAFLVRSQGRRALANFTGALRDGRWPGDEVVQGGLVLVGGALLLTPGFVTDAAGLLLVLPPTRALVARRIRKRVTWSTGTIGGGVVPGPRAPADAPTTVDVEVVDVRRMDIDAVEEEET